MLRRVYLAGLIALMVATAGGVFCNGLFFIAQPYQINYGEGVAAWEASRVTDLPRAYAPIDRYPFVVFQYPPLFHLVARGMGGDLLAAGRSVSLLSAAILCIVAGWIAFQALPRRTGWRGRMLAAVFAGALPTTLYNFNWTWLARVDTLAILLSVSGVALFAARPRSAAAQILASVLMVAALFTRQTALAAPLACVLVGWLLDRKIALRMLITMGLLGGAALGWLAWQTHGQVLLHLFRYNQTAFSIGRALLGLLMNTRHVVGLLVLAIGAALVVVRRWRWNLLSATLRANRYRRNIFLLAVYSVLAAISALAFGKEGSDINYFLEWNVSLAPLAGIFFLRLLPDRVTRPRPASLAAALVPLLLLTAGFDQARTGWMRVISGPLPADRQQMDDYRRMLAIVKEAPGPVFTEDMNLLYKAGKDIPAEPAMIQCLAKAGMWDERPFVRMIQDQRFDMVVAMLNRETEDRFSRERYSPAVAGAIEQFYVQTAMISDYMIYRPRRP